MMQVKFFTGKYNTIERDINEFLERIGREPGVRIDIKDIKFNSDSSTNDGAAMVIYNKFKNITPTKP